MLSVNIPEEHSIIFKLFIFHETAKMKEKLVKMLQIDNFHSSVECCDYTA